MNAVLGLGPELLENGKRITNGEGGETEIFSALFRKERAKPKCEEWYT